MNEELKIKFQTTTYPQPTQNSPLKKKLTLLNKLKNIDSNYTSIITDFIPENMSKFLSEISANILYNLNDKKIDHLLHVIHYFTVYNEFLDIFVSQLQSTIKTNINTNIYYHLILYCEMMNYFIEYRSLHKIINKTSIEQTIKLFVHLCKDPKYKTMIIDYCILNKDKLDDHLEQITYIFTKYEENDKLKENFLERNFVKVIDVFENEFDFYEPKDTVETDLVIQDLLDNATSFTDKPELIDSIAKKMIDEKAVIKDIIKCMTKPQNTVVFARLVSNFDILPKFVQYLEANDNLAFLCELSKHKKYPHRNILKVLEDSIRSKNYAKIICILNSCGRFYLQRNDTNHSMRKALEKIVNLKNEITGCNRIEINNCLSKIFSKQDTRNLDDYLSNCDLLKLDRNIIILLAMKPWIFSDNRLFDAINALDIPHIKQLTEQNVFVCLYSDKISYALSYAKFYSKYGYNSEFMNKVIESGIVDSKKAYCLMAYIEDIEKGCVEEIEMLVCNCDSEVKSYWANYKVKYGIVEDDMNFEEEMKMLAMIE